MSTKMLSEYEIPKTFYRELRLLNCSPWLMSLAVSHHMRGRQTTPEEDAIWVEFESADGSQNRAEFLSLRQIQFLCPSENRVRAVVGEPRFRAHSDIGAAVIEFNAMHPNDGTGTVVLWPFPVGSDLRPLLPTAKYPQFLAAAALMLRSGPEKCWDVMSLKSEAGIPEHTGDGISMLEELERARVVTRCGSEFKANMTADEFERLFGVRLPELPLQEPPPKGFTLGEFVLYSDKWRICGPLTAETANALACDFVNQRCVGGLVLIISTNPLRGIWLDGLGRQHNLVEPTV